MSAVKRVEFVSDRMSYRPIVLKGRWCNTFVLNVHTPSEEKSDDSKDSFYKELVLVLNHLPKFYMKLPLGDFMQMGKIFSNRQLGMRVFITTVTIIVLE